jgi:hypothetical protein
MDVIDRRPADALFAGRILSRRQAGVLFKQCRAVEKNALASNISLMS